jgi:hypothetical protein
MDERLLVWQLEGPIDRQRSEHVTALLQSRLTLARATAVPPRSQDDAAVTGPAAESDPP